jgi:nucleoside-diphosphate-sugar epimerase
MSMSEAHKILVLGASGLIGHFVTDDLRARGFPVIGIASAILALAKDKPAKASVPIESERRLYFFV